MSNSNLNPNEHSNSKSSKRESGLNDTALDIPDHGIQFYPITKLFEKELKDIYWAEKALIKSFSHIN